MLLYKELYQNSPLDRDKPRTNSSLSAVCMQFKSCTCGHEFLQASSLTCCRPGACCVPKVNLVFVCELFIFRSSCASQWGHVLWDLWEASTSNNLLLSLTFLY
jgi:hypothetical protein